MWVSHLLVRVWRTGRTGKPLVVTLIWQYHISLLKQSPFLRMASLLCPDCKTNTAAEPGLISYNGFFPLQIDKIMVACDVFDRFGSYFWINKHNRWRLHMPSRQLRQMFPLKNKNVWGLFRPTQMESINNCLFFPNMIRYFMLPFDVCDKGRVCACVCGYMCVSIQGLSAVICRAGNRKCNFNSIETLLHPQTGWSQITDQLLCALSAREEGEFKNGWTRQCNSMEESISSPHQWGCRCPAVKSGWAELWHECLI